MMCMPLANTCIRWELEPFCPVTHNAEPFRKTAPKNYVLNTKRSPPVGLKGGSEVCAACSFLGNVSCSLHRSTAVTLDNNSSFVAEKCVQKSTQTFQNSPEAQPTSLVSIHMLSMFHTVIFLPKDINPQQSLFMLALSVKS